MQPLKASALSIVTVTTALLLVGCGTPPLVQLNEPARSSMGLDMANLLAPRQIPYETMQKGSISVNYNLLFAKSENLSGYRLTLILRNNGEATQVLEPTVTLQDSGGFLLPPYAYETFIAEAATLAGTVVPTVPSNAPSNYYSSGTIRNTTTGSTYTYSGKSAATSSGSFASGFAQGMAQGAATRAANAKEEGRFMIRWANSYWLKNGYELPPGAAAAGALFFPAATLGQLPLKLRVSIAGQTFEFVSATR